jgi:signal transduction histidine kinase
MKQLLFEEACETLLQSLQEFFVLLAKRYNSTITEEPLMMTVTRLPNEKCSDRGKGHWINQDDSIRRLIIATSHWALSIRGRAGLVESFVVPATELMNLSASELPSRAKLTLKPLPNIVGAWSLNGATVTGDEMNALMRGLFKDVIGRSRSDYDHSSDAMRLIASGYSFAGAIQSLVAEKHALVQKIVDQQESIQKSLSRDIHDAVLGNVMLLKSSLSGAKGTPEEELLSLLDEIAVGLRNICQELSPRDLEDCGLQPMLEELSRTFAMRVGLQITFRCTNGIPVMPTEVALHIYRIAQECFNNIAKHAKASSANLSIEVNEHVFTMIISDNGIGFDPTDAGQRTAGNGIGAGIIRERAELISCVYPARVWFESKPGKGAKTTLEIITAKDASS